MIERAHDNKAPQKKSVKIVEMNEKEPDSGLNETEEDTISMNRRRMIEKLSGKKRSDLKWVEHIIRKISEILLFIHPE